MRWLALCLMLLIASSAMAAKMQRCTLSMRGQHWKVEKAVTLEERRTGLMNRKRVKPGTGMLFLFAEPQEVGMWMKDTLVPLDMVFVGADGRIAYIERRATPQSLDAIKPEGNMRAVVEIPGGEAKKAGLRIGDKVNLKRCY